MQNIHHLFVELVQIVYIVFTLLYICVKPQLCPPPVHLRVVIDINGVERKACVCPAGSYVHLQ